MSGNTHDVMVIGAGFAGMAAALFAAQAGLSVAQSGVTGGIDFSTGFIDLMGVHPVAEGVRWDDPWAAVEAVSRDCSKHPYARMNRPDMEAAIDGFTDFLASQGLEYTGHADRNCRALTPAGTVKRTWRVPRTAWKGVLALESAAPTVIVDFHGLKGFSGRQLVEMRKATWPGLRTARVTFPRGSGELYPEHMAWALADPKYRAKLAEAVAPHLGDAEYLGFPAVLGLVDPGRVVAHLEELTGRQVFEIPTIPPSIAGPRLRGAFDRGLPPLGVRTLSQATVTEAGMDRDGFRFVVGRGGGKTEVRAGAAILATGRFFGKGLMADRHAIREAVFDLPVVQPETREQWHDREFFNARGHAANASGLEVDELFRPLARDGRPAHERLFAAGAILAHQDWMRMKCGAGLAITSAWRAVQGLRQGVD
ncbi:glycerol-3-phosphate dehydrogenase subunit GlpB [Pseudodesulfovibrio methanolicus]|uniref:Glycerol-3-phosphate dehydrogenase subunit GlpB n=1 Tax=Pseudodesulfovibrio methanolicus TaxID=3126690 RepID=A0ABZ2IU57_9BACT